MKALVIFLLLSPLFSHSKVRKSSIDRADSEKEECAYTAQGDRYDAKWRKLMNSLAMNSSSESDQEKRKPGEDSASE